MRGVRGDVRVAALAAVIGIISLLQSGTAAAQSGATPGASSKAQQQKGAQLKGASGLATPEDIQAAARRSEDAALALKQREEQAALQRQLAEVLAASARHSRDVTYAAVGLVIVTAGLWLMCFLQSRDLKAAVRAAHDTSAAAMSAADFMQQALVLTQRATVIVGEPRAVWLRDAHGRLVGCRLLVTWHNVGTTPTRDMIAAVAGLATDKPPARSSALPRMDARQQPLIIGPHGAVNSAHVNLPVGLLADILRRRAYYQLAGWAEYNDVFDRTPRHRVEFCYWLEIDGDLEAQQLEARFHIHGKHNRHCESWSDGGVDADRRDGMAEPSKVKYGAGAAPDLPA